MTASLVSAIDFNAFAQQVIVALDKFPKICDNIVYFP